MCCIIDYDKDALLYSLNNDNDDDSLVRTVIQNKID